MMGTHLIPNAPSVQEAADYLGEPLPARTWTRMEADVLFSDSNLTNPECAALYAEYTPSGVTDRDYEKPVPPAVRTSINMLDALYALNPATLNDAQTATAIRNILVVLRFVYRNMEG